MLRLTVRFHRNLHILKEGKIKKASEVINTSLTNIEGDRLRQSVQLGLVPPEFTRIADSLRAMLPPNPRTRKSVFSDSDWQFLLAKNDCIGDILSKRITNQNGSILISLENLSEAEVSALGEEIYLDLLDHVVTFDLEQNGMGYNNLIYMGTVLGDLQELKQIELCSFNTLLIEEPEAHLHPQLQDLVFDFFKSVCDDKGGSVQASSVQIFITTHSPTLISKSDITSIHLLYENADGILMVAPLKNCPLDLTDRNDLRRYLDVTKSQLFFSKGIIFVEGISEALLLPVFAKRINNRLDQNAIEVVNISGTAFEPFAKLFNSNNELERIGLPCVIITDDDRCTIRTDPNRITDVMEPDEISKLLPIGQISPRALKAKELKGGNLLVKVAFKTFEYELARIPENVEPILKALSQIHPLIASSLRAKFQDIKDPELRAVYLWLAIKDAKAEFAQRLSEILNNYNADQTPEVFFKVPNYIKEAIEHVSPTKK